ncbi:TetR/AcrR family transcriptional regulator [Nocardioides marmoriginsengisoli]|uniref:TetR/AcrR family transcriptional regulator n=1 Tax=Nocardioides marmoriginsengisoli TaxID=661483 RepID=A0A3N0CHL1_9ACTN|nr:TetR/AcrR family transcriptional regulator [Nocardioides marmoriginsengisoli]RNL62935.1 TetR/AcrR family transcriptional regulator [Nocardioides marmoriginsengisoli]
MQTRDRILDAALEQFTAKGYDATSMREIGEQLGITKAALYYHFASKEDIVRALLVEIEGQVGELVTWARTQPFGPELRSAVLARWSDIMQAHGLTAFRFFVANRRIVLDVSPDRSGMHAKMDELYALLAPGEASVDEQLRIRLALMAVNMAGMVGAGIDAPDEEILASARRVAEELMPDPRHRGSAD